MGAGGLSGSRCGGGISGGFGCGVRGGLLALVMLLPSVAKP
jgi:hypothetical protein